MSEIVGGEHCFSCDFWISATGDWYCEECGEPTCERCGKLDHVEGLFLCPECFVKEGPKK
jgi:predicted RNA-binding Zn-ribbon protein involved in translation (DUF1610 family)